MLLPIRPEASAKPDDMLIKALARAFRWKRLLESGEFTAINELAEREGIAPFYMTRVLCFTLLAPNIVEAILDGRQGSDVALAQVLEPFPVEWGTQARHSIDDAHGIKLPFAPCRGAASKERALNDKF